MATRATVRRSIGLRAGQPFFVRFGATSLTATGGSTTTLVDSSNLVQADDFWNGQHLYLPSSGETRVISDFTQSSHTITFLEPVSSGITNGTAYEIWSQFSAADVNAAISQALRDAWPYFFTQNEGYIVVQSDVGVDHSLSDLDPPPKWVAQVLLEQGISYVKGYNTGAPGSQKRVVDTNTTFTSDDVGKEVRIYKGTSAGDRRTVTSVVDSNTLEVDSNFTTTLDTSSYYMLADVEQQTVQYGLMWRWSVDKGSSPTILRLSSKLSGYEGYLLRIVYEAEYEDPTQDSDTILCPQEYVELSVLSRLYLTRLASAPRSEMDSWIALQRAYAEAAQAFAVKSQMRHYSGTIIDDQTGYVVRASDWPF